MTLLFKKTKHSFKSFGSRVTELTITRPFVSYFLLVLVIYAVVYMPLPLQGKMYIYRDIGTDTFDSYWPMYAFIRDYFHDFQFNGWSFQHGLGSSVVAAAPWIFDPFNLFIIPFSKNNIDMGIFLATTAKVLTLSLLAYRYLARLGYRGIPLIASSISYTFCGYFIGWGQHYQFATMFVLFTLVLYCFEGWLQSFHWPGLVAAIALLAAFWPYTLYMTLVFLAVYYLFRYGQLFPLNGLSFLTRSLFTLGLIFWGIAAGAVFFLPQVYAIGQSERISAQVLPSLLAASRNEYYTIFMRMFSNGLLGVNNFSGHLNYYEAPFFYTSILFIILLPRLFLNDVRKKRYVWVLLVCSFLLVFPGFANPVFGAFSSSSYRWTFVLVPVFVSALAEALTVIQNNSYKWTYGAGIGLAGVAGLAAWILNRPFYPGILGLSVPVSVAIMILSCLFYGIVLFQSRMPITPYHLLMILVFETALTGFTSVNWRTTVAASDKPAAPYLEASTNQALERISSEDQSFFRINKNYHELYLNDALFQSFYGEKQYSSITPGYIRDMEEYFGLTEPRSNYLAGFSGRQALRDISAVKYMLTPQKHSYAGYEYVTQMGDLHIFRNNNASSLGTVYQNFITLDNFKKLDWAARQYILYDAVVVPSESGGSLSELNEVDKPLLNHSSAVSLDEDFKKNKVRVLENDFPHHLQVLFLKDAESYLVVNFTEPASTSIDIVFSVTSTLRSTGKVFFKTPESDYNHNDSTTFTLQPGTHNYYVTVPAIGVDAIRLSISQVAGTFSMDNFAVFHRDDEGIAKQASLLSSNISIDTFRDDYIRATTDLEKAGLIYFSIPFDQGWKLYVDGTLSKKIQANLAFTGVHVGPGSHVIELTYSIPWLKEGTVISIVALVLLTLFGRKTTRSDRLLAI
jgi:uncharacterized membrane protein YfhO